MEAEPQLQCKCKVGRCPQCFRCSRCGCGHDGNPPELTGKRKRGRPPGPRKQARVSQPTKDRPKRASTTYQPGDFVVEPEPVGDGSADMVDLTRKKPVVPRCLSLSAVLQAFGMEAYAETATVSRSLVVEIMQRVCAVLCENNAKAGAELVQSVLRSQLQDQEDESLLHTIAQCFAVATKGSVEKRVLRACLVQAKRSKLQELSKKISRFSMANTSFSAGRQELEMLKKGVRFEMGFHPRQRFNDAEVSRAVKHVVFGANIALLSWEAK